MTSLRAASLGKEGAFTQGLLPAAAYALICILLYTGIYSMSEKSKEKQKENRSGKAARKIFWDNLYWAWVLLCGAAFSNISEIMGTGGGPGLKVFFCIFILGAAIISVFDCWRTRKG